MRRSQFIRLFYLFLLGLGLGNCDNNSSKSTKPSREVSNELRIWWHRGFYPEESEAIEKIVANWKQNTGIAVRLTFISDRDVVGELKNALSQGNPPDIFFSETADLTIVPHLAWNNQLVDVSEILEYLKDSYSENALKSVYYSNKVDKKRSYYAVPIMQRTVHLHYWKDLIATVGQTKESIPSDWQRFWQFWGEVQSSLRASGNPDIYAMGLPMSFSTDTFDIFEHFLEAYNYKPLDEFGEPLLDAPLIVKTVTAALEKYASFYQQQQVPPEALNWTNADNNVSFLSRNSLMSANPTLSIPGSQRNNKQVYAEEIATIIWPKKPNGDPMKSITSIKQVIILEASDKQQAAKNFLSYLAQPQNLQAYTKGSQGRFFPVMPKLLEDPFWQDSTDPHITIALKQFERTRLPYQVLNPAYSEVLSDNIWAKAIQKILLDGLSPEVAAKQAIEKIENIWDKWK